MYVVISVPRSVDWLHMAICRLVNLGLNLLGEDKRVWIVSIPAHVIDWTQFIQGIPAL